MHHAENLGGTVLDVGCGEMPYKELILTPGSRVEKYVGLDLKDNNFDRKVLPDLSWDGVCIPLPDQSVDFAIATEVFEHCPDAQVVVNEINRVLKHGGTLLFTIPFLWPLHEVPYDYFRFTPFILQDILAKAGFGCIELKMLGGWDASLAQMMGLWVIRRPGLNPILRILLRLIFTPVVALLRRTDTRPDEFTEGQMITGLCGVARK